MPKLNTLNQAQITLKVDPALKEKTLNKARKEGITLKALLIMAMRGYLNNELFFGLRSKETPSKYLLDSIHEAEDDLKKGNINSFKNTDEMTKHLQSL